MLRKLSVLAIAAAGLAITTGPPALAQGMPMGSMKTAKDLDDQAKARQEERQQAQAPARVTPTYHDAVEDRLMREKTDDGAHDRNDTTR